MHPKHQPNIQTRICYSKDEVLIKTITLSQLHMHCRDS